MGVNPRILGLLGVAASLAAAIAVVNRRQRQVAATPPPRDPKDVAPDTEAAEAVEREWTCACGKEYRITGEGRHRVYWPSDATVSDPVLGQECVECGRPFPLTDAAAAG